MSEDYEKLTVRFSKEELARINRLRIADGYGNKNAVTFDAVKGLLEKSLNESPTIYVLGVDMGGSVHKSTGKAGQ